MQSMNLAMRRRASGPTVGRVRAGGILVAAALFAVSGWFVRPTDDVRVPGPNGAAVPAPGAVAAGSGSAGSGSAGVGQASAVDRLALAERLAFWVARVDEQPGDFLSWLHLAAAHAEHARHTADVASYERAAVAVATAVEIVPNYPPAFGVRAALRFATHDFAGAIGDAERVLESLPRNPAALAVLGDALAESGRLDAAADAVGRLASVAAGPAVDVRMARLAYLSGDPSRAVVLARAAYDAAVRSGDPDAAFYAYALGEYARLAGDVVVARAGFEAALAARPDDLGALLGLARIDAFDGRLDAAVAGLRRAAAIAPQPETVALLGDLLATAGDRAGARLQYDTVRLTGELSALAGAVYDRQLSLFELDHGGASEALFAAARAALEVRSDAGGHDLVAWAAYRLGRLDEARRASVSALASGTRDARILFHAGAIELAGGDAARGRASLRDALALGPALDPPERAEAERLLAGS